MKNFRKLTTLCLVTSLCVSACKKKDPGSSDPEPEQSLSKVSTSPVTSVTDVSAIGGGAMLTHGSDPVTETGICWDTLPAPALDKGSKAKAAAISNYTCAITGLKSYTKYYVRAYATSAKGTVYGSEVSFVSSDVWTRHTIGPQGTIVYSMIANSKGIYAGTTKGLYFSPDGGLTWSAAGLNGLSVSMLAQQDNVMMAGMSDHAFYRSEDSGTTWVKTTDAKGAPNITGILIDGNFVMTAEYDAIYTSADKGYNWTNVDPSPSPVQYGALVKAGNTIYAQMYNTVDFYKSNNRGESWQLSKGPKGTFLQQVATDIDKIENTVFMSTPYGLHNSQDEGNTWTRIEDAPSKSALISVSGNAILCYGTNPVEPKISYDKGATWSALAKKGLDTSIPNPVDVLLSEKAIYIYTHNGLVYRLRR